MGFFPGPQEPRAPCCPWLGQVRWSKARRCHECGRERGGGSGEEAERDKEMDPGLSHVAGGRAESNLGRGTGRQQRASAALELASRSGVLSLSHLRTHML